MSEQVIDITELKQDEKNFNKGTAKGRKLMKKSFQELGAGRSILIDKDGNIIAGNKSQQSAQEAGIKKVRIIESDGTELIAVKRTDVSLDSKKGREMALADNATAKADIEWDPDLISQLGDLYDIETSMYVPEDQELQINMDDISDNLQHFRQVIVVCHSEDEMNELANQFKQEGYKCSTLTL
jgi:hypothetical protein